MLTLLSASLRPAYMGSVNRLRLNGLPVWLATARVSKHSMFAFVPSSWTPSEQVVIVPVSSWSAFAVLQSRVHGLWVALQATHMGEGIRYSASECFAPFPFPERDPRAVIPALEEMGERLYVARAKHLRQREIGLTQAYNDLTDAAVEDLDIVRLREIHEELDRVVLDAYGWTGIAVPSLTLSDAAFEDAVAGRLFALNAFRTAIGGGAAPANEGVPGRARGPGVRRTTAAKPAKSTRRPPRTG